MFVSYRYLFYINICFNDYLRHRAVQARHGPGSLYTNTECTKKGNRLSFSFYILPDSSGAQLSEPKLALTCRTKTKAYNGSSCQRARQNRKRSRVKRNWKNEKLGRLHQRRKALEGKALLPSARVMEGKKSK